jgi:hypothetical protein
VITSVSKLIDLLKNPEPILDPGGAPLRGACVAFNVSEKLVTPGSITRASTLYSFIRANFLQKTLPGAMTKQVTWQIH